MAKETKDVFLDKDGKVVEAGPDAVEMRRVVIEDGVVVERSVWYADTKLPE
jgi:hypothetical protein